MLAFQLQDESPEGGGGVLLARKGVIALRYDSDGALTSWNGFVYEKKVVQTTYEYDQYNNIMAIRTNDALVGSFEYAYDQIRNGTMRPSRQASGAIEERRHLRYFDGLRVL